MAKKLRALIAVLLCVCLTLGVMSTAAAKAPVDTYGLARYIEKALAEKEEIKDTINLGINKPKPVFPKIDDVLSDHTGNALTKLISALWQYLEAFLNYIVAS
ncbi:MAG: hypothetical protein GXY95_02875, partial [Clostridiales bacterium]|nr:hypothetical protein [Clostridiales bacterium]